MTAAMRDLGAELESPALVCLEGGYSPSALADSVVATLAALNNGTAPRGEGRGRRASPVTPARAVASLGDVAPHSRHI